MKRILIVCLLGMGLLLPSTTITAKEFSHKESAKRIVDVTLEHDMLGITSSGSGTLVQVDIYNSQEQKVYGEGLSGYSDSVDLSGLANGTYRAHVTTSSTTYDEYFVLS